MPNRTDHDVGRGAWNILRMALLWARKGGGFKRRLIMDQLRLFPKFIKTGDRATRPGHLQYGERQLSFDKTPIFCMKMHRPSSSRFNMPRIPCINPPVDFDHEFGDDHISENPEDGINVRADEFIAKFYNQLKLQRQISHLQYHEML